MSNCNNLIQCMRCSETITRYHFEDNDKLSALAFADAQLYISCIRTFKSFVLVGDIFQGVALFRFTDELVRVKGKEVLAGSLVKTSQDDAPQHVVSTEFFVHGEHLGFASFDNDHNMTVYAFVPQDRVTQGGRTLMKQADISVGCCVTAVIRLRCYDHSTPFASPVPAARHLMIYGSKEGSCGLVLPVTEDM